MGARLVYASKDEYGRISKGAAGDQTTREVLESKWYSRPWDLCIRPNSQVAAAVIAEAARKIAASPAVGYDQGQRLTLYAACSRIGWDLNRISELQPCECDCSSLVAVVLRFAGIEIPETVWTGNLEYYLLQTGNFHLMKGTEYLDNDDYLRTGDILINRVHHAAIVSGSGDKATVDVFYIGRVKVSDYLQVRSSPKVAPDNEYMINGSSCRLPPDTRIIICEQSGRWGRLFDTNAWVSLNYIIAEGVQ